MLLLQIYNMPLQKIAVLQLQYTYYSVTKVYDTVVMTRDCKYLCVFIDFPDSNEGVIFAYVVIREASSEQIFSIHTVRCWARM